MSKEFIEYLDDDDLFDDEITDCPKCGRTYDDADFDFEICSHCGWSVCDNTYLI